MDDNYTQKINIGARILNSARGNLYLAMRFMDIALCAFAYKPDEGRQMAGTDGNVIYYCPDYVMDRYEAGRGYADRLYLHMTLHCIYRHIFRISNRKVRLWNLACDIAVEHVIDGLPYGCVRMRIPAVRDLCYRKISEYTSILNADLIYKYLENNPMDEDTLKAWENEFLVDDHTYWYREDKNSRSNMKNEQKCALPICLYCAVVIPRITPRNVSTAVMVPTTCSPYGRRQMLASAKYSVPIAGSSSCAIHFSTLYVLSHMRIPPLHRSLCGKFAACADFFRRRLDRTGLPCYNKQGFEETCAVDSRYPQGCKGVRSACRGVKDIA